MKAIYEKFTVNIILTGGKLKAFPLRSETKQWYQLLPLPFSKTVEVPFTTISQGKEMKCIYIENKERNLFLFTDDISYM